MTASDANPINPEGYPLEEALQTIDIFSLGQEGEPQVVTFGGPIKHYAGVAVGEESVEVRGQSFTVPRREPILVSTYENLGQMAADLKGKTATDSELFEQRVQMLTEQGVLQEAPIEIPQRLPRTTAEEEAVASFKSNCLSLSSIKDAARERAERNSGADASLVTVVNTSTGESHTIKLDVSTLISDDELYLTRGYRDEYSLSKSGNVTASTYLEIGEMFKKIAVRLGLKPDNTALLAKEGDRERLYSLDGLFSAQPSIANDFWSESGDYTDAGNKPGGSDASPPRYSLYDKGNYRRVDSYDVGDVLDTAQGALVDQVNFILRLGGSDKLALQPVSTPDSSFYELRRKVGEVGLELGYSFLAEPFFSPAFMAVKLDGHIERYLEIDSRDIRLSLQNSLRELEIWRATR